MCTDVALIDEDDGSESEWTDLAVEFLDMRMNLANTRISNALPHNLEHPCAVFFDRRRNLV
jgi:hypothetical protein